MALVTCGNCKNQVSQSDLTCPHCGHRIKQKLEWWKNAKVYQFTGLFLMGIGLFVGIAKGGFIWIGLLLIGIAVFFASKLLPSW